MALMDGWTICDRCSFKYRRRQMRKEATGFVVCQKCYDGKYDAVRHPQNRPFRPRRELLPIPDGRPQDIPPTPVLVLEDDTTGYLLTEAGEIIEIVELPEYNINQSIYIRVA